MSSTNTNRDTTKGDDYDEPIQYVNDFSNNPIPFITGVYNQEPITY